jgi:hypothetical protein
MSEKELSIVLHCSDSAWGNAAEIRRWHVDGNGWDDIGYQYVIGNGRTHPHIGYCSLFDGAVEVGRRMDGDDKWEPWEYGAHVRGHNHHTIGVCMIGKDKFTRRQMVSFAALHDHLSIRFKHRLPVKGHYEFDPSKTCPNLNMDRVRAFLEAGWHLQPAG